MAKSEAGIHSRRMPVSVPHAYRDMHECEIVCTSVYVCMHTRERTSRKTGQGTGRVAQHPFNPSTWGGAETGVSLRVGG